MTYGYFANLFPTSPYDGAAAASMLYEPGATASVSGPYSGAYAHEGENGSIYTYQFSYNKSDFTSSSNYLYQGPSDTTKFSEKYTNYLDHTAASPYSDPKLYGEYYSSYPSPYGSTTTVDRTYDAHNHYSGHNEYLDSTTRYTTQTSGGYVLYTYLHDTFERTDGNFVRGSGEIDYEKTITDPYGYATTTSRTTFS